MSASEQAALTAANKQRVIDFFAALNRGDGEAIVAAYAEDGHVHTMGRTLISGRYNKQQITDSCSAIFDSFPVGLAFEIDAITAEGERVAVEARSSGEHVSGLHYSNEYHFLFKFRGGLLLELKEYMDTERVTDVLCGGQRAVHEA